MKSTVTFDFLFVRSAAAVLIAVLLAGGLVFSPARAYQPTPFPTPTPGPDGRIVYQVQPGDTLWRIAAVSGVSIDELRILNNLSADDVIVEGQNIILGLAGPALITPTVGPTATAAAVTPTPTAEMGTGMLCILLYDDINGDALRQETEMSIPNGAVLISQRNGDYSQNVQTQEGDAADCFEGIPQGDYNITVAAPEGYNPTTNMNYALSIAPGDETYLDFGAQLNAQAQAEATEIPVEQPAGQGNSPVLGIVGGLLLLAGAGLAFYATRLRR